MHIHVVSQYRLDPCPVLKGLAGKFSSINGVLSTAAVRSVRRRKADDEGAVVAAGRVELDSDAESANALPAQNAPGGLAVHKNDRCPYTGKLVREG